MPAGNGHIVRQESQEKKRDREARSIGNFRLKLLLATALIASSITFCGVVLAEHHLAQRNAQELQMLIERETLGAINARTVRQAVLQDICERLSRQPRIHAALEDDALDLLYPTAKNELHRLLVGAGDTPREAIGLQAVFYRFLDQRGKLILPAEGDGAGWLSPELGNQLELHALLDEPQKGYFLLSDQLRIPGEEATIVEVFATPVVSMVTFRPIAALLVGFPFMAAAEERGFEGMTGVMWTRSGSEKIEGPAENSGASIAWDSQRNGGQPLLDDEGLEWLEGWLNARLDLYGGDWTVRSPTARSALRIIARPLNRESAYPLAYVVFVTSLAKLDETLARSRAQIIGAGAVLFMLGLVLSHWIASRFSKPVEALAEFSQRERIEREQAEARLDATAEELRRQARFSADASHQLKTPVSVMRVGLEELLNYGKLSSPQRQEVLALIGQTDRLTRVIDDLLLLSRMDSGRLRLTQRPESLRRMVEGLVDDLSLVQETGELRLELDVDENLWVLGDRVYTSQILQCLLENAWKYNHAGGHVQIRAWQEDDWVTCSIGNTGPGILPENREHIFERFHRASSGENVPGYGLGLNMARELARLHGGELRLVNSNEDWTEFELLLKSASLDAGRSDKVHNVNERPEV